MEHASDCDGNCGGQVLGVELVAERGATVDELTRLVADTELRDAHADQITTHGTDWDFGAVRMWIAMIRVGDMVGVS